MRDSVRTDRLRGLPSKRRPGHRKRRPAKGRRYNQKKVVFKNCHRFRFGLLITPSGIRIPYPVPHYSKEYCTERGLVHRTTADMIAALTLPQMPK